MDKVLFLIPYAFSFAISLGVLIYAWRYRHMRGARAYAWYMAGQCLWILGFIFELLNPTLEGKILWDQFQWVGVLVITVVFPIFAIQYTETKVHRPKILFSLSLILPILFLVLLFTDSRHHLLYPNPYLDHKYILSDLIYDFTWVVYGYSIYGYLVTFTGLGLLIMRFFSPHTLYRRQISTVVIGFLIPIFFTMLTMAGVEFLPFRDISPFTLAIGNLVVSWGLFRYHLFDIIPIARDIVMENLVDLVIVLDTQNRVVDANPAALFALNRKPAQLIGQSAEVVFAQWHELLERFNEIGNINAEFLIEAFGRVLSYEVKSTVLEDKKQRYLGRVFVARDISKRIELQNSLQKLNEDLEERVRERTEELRKSAEQYRAVVENQTEFIVRWKPDRTRTFVNEAYCRYFGLTLEQALQIDFLDLIVEEDRPAVEEKIYRLKSSTIKSATEIHRVVKPDGSIGWQEWTDQVICDKEGNVIEFQSIGRDITERKQAEDELRKLSHAVEQSNVSIVITDAFGTIEYVNPYFSELTGYSLQEAIGANPRILKSGVTDVLVYQDLWNTVIQGREWQGEFCNKKKNGELYWESASISPILDSSGKITHIVAVKTDITEHMRAELALRQSEKKHRSLFEAAKDSIFIMQMDRIIDCNVQTLKMFGCNWEQIIGKSPVDFSPVTQPDGQDSQEKALKYLETVLRGEPQFFEWKHCRLDQTQFDAEVSLNPLELENEIYVQAIVRDITGRKESERTILEQLAFNKLMIDLLTRFSTCTGDEVDTAIQTGLQKIADFIGGDHLMVSSAAEDRSTWSILYEWHAEHVPSIKQIYQQTPFGTLLWEENRIITGNIVRITKLDDFPPEAIATRNMHEAEGALSILNIPIIGLAGQIRASISLESHVKPTVWTDNDVEWLTMFGDIIANLLERKRAEDNLVRAYDTTLEGWAKALEMRDKETKDHSERVTELTVQLAKVLGIKGDDLVQIRRGAILHDIGKMAIPDSILRKPGSLTLEERMIIKEHPNFSYKLLSNIPFLEKAMEIPYCHHERWDGSGYPQALKGNDIPFSARIFAIVDVWDALLSDRPYSAAWPREKAILYLKDESGRQFDPECIKVFLDLVEQGKI